MLRLAADARRRGSRPSCSRRPARSRPAARSTDAHALDDEERERGVVTWSAGNHAQAVAWAAREEGVDCARRDVGGREPAQDRGDARLRRDRRPLAARSRRGVRRALELVEAATGASSSIRTATRSSSPGHGTLALELLEDVPELETRRRRRRRRRARSPASSRRSTAARASIARRAGALAGASRRARGRHSRCRVEHRHDRRRPRAAVRRRPAARALPRPASRPSSSTEDEIADGMRFLYARAKLACEPAGAAAAARCSRARSERGPNVAVIVSGGNVEPKQAAAILRGQ